MPISVVPQPVEIAEGTGSFTIGPTTCVVAVGPAASEAKMLVDYLAPALGYRLELRSAAQADGGIICLQIDPKLKLRNDEGYRLEVTATRIDLRAASRAGLFHGIQTLRQLLPVRVFSSKPVAGVDWSVPAVTITDAPRFGWRGLLIDPARHFIPAEDVKRFIDAMALHKFNRLQMHLTDDQGWRIEIKKYPKLTEIGCWRDETLIGHLRKKPWHFDGKRHGGFYSQDEIRELVAYAAARHITIVPEIEMPGHFRAAISAYPFLGVFPKKQKGLSPWTRWGVSDDILAPRPEGIQFCKDVLAEVMDLFPSQYIHVGGDEAVKTQWKESDEIQEMIRELGLHDEEQLQAWFIRKIDAFLTEHGRRLIGWDEILQGGLAPGATVMSWRGESGGVTAAKAGHDVVMAPTSHTYFDYCQGPPEQEPLSIGGHLPLDRVYEYEPVPAALDTEQTKHVLGAQAQLWSEYITTPEHWQYMAFPRACALSEVLWSPKGDRDFERFLTRLDRHLTRLDEAGVNYRPLDGKNASGEQANTFGISIDEEMRAKWGFEYPVTYVFRASNVSPRTTVLCRDTESESWSPLERRTSQDFFNGVECVRFDGAEGKAYVSVGFGKTERIELRFLNAGSVSFDTVAKYYDDRKAAYTLSNDNWGRKDTANAGAPWRGMTDDASDKYQASVHACRMFHLPVSVAINSQLYGEQAIWERIQEELDRGDRSWEPAVHTRHHPCSEKGYLAGGYTPEIVGCRDDLLQNLGNIPYGQYIFEFILPCAYKDDAVRRASAGEFLFLRDWNNQDNPASTDFTRWNSQYQYYGIGGPQTRSYDAIMEARSPKGRFYAEDVMALNDAFDVTYKQGGVFYAMWHADRYENSVVYDPRPGVDGVAGSTLMQHFGHVADRHDVWYVANGWLYCYRYVAQHVEVSGGS